MAILQTITVRTIMRHHRWLLVIWVSMLSSCSSDSPAINAALAPADHSANTITATHCSPTSAVIAAEEFSVSDPSPNEPVTATMLIRPEGAAAGETVEVLVFARIARAHYLHAASEPGGPFVPVAMNVAFPKEVEALGDWQLPPAEMGHGNAPVYRDSILLRRSLKVLSTAPPQSLLITGELQYQACTDELCWPPGKLKLSAPFAIQSHRR